jgi:hypothetical protein
MNRRGLMTRIGKGVIAALAVITLFSGVSGCEKQKGPAERAGESVDNAVNKTGEQIEKAGDKIQDAAKGEKN